MKIYSGTFPSDRLTAFQRNFINEKMLFLDIETTGLSPSRDRIYCVGCGYLMGGQIQSDLFFSEAPEDEAEILKDFYHLLSRFDTIVTFNGTTFDLPFIRKRTGILLPSLPLSPETAAMNSIDLYREAARLKNFLGLPSCRQKAVEQFLGCSREDRYSGGELISIYQEYVSGRNPDLLRLLLLHNSEDIRGMFSLTGILAYRQLGDGRFCITDLIREKENDQNYLNIKIVPEYEFPCSIHRQTEDAFLALGQKTAMVRFPLRHGVLKHYFSDLENYYYLPDEDTAIHKSIGEFVDPSHRKKATKKNCYIKKECDYITIPGKSADSYLKREYNEKNTYLEIPAGKDSCRDFLQNYFLQWTR